ncbi:polysaccharide deacetylase family protein [Alicyclobacillus sp.]|uniref:polysaccharide deacetylase family protein n=1 Tax=Alicyclobacillus sp. TaxID=61169 RepID=UPI0025BFD2BC|nr:polysaccharide deacetylase family protein [Alicyclobacillus sp.]MCL6517612.1 polysaccharide deacetylase family protein [Alicyclobacillus sp.]
MGRKHRRFIVGVTGVLVCAGWVTACGEGHGSTGARPVAAAPASDAAGQGNGAQGAISGGASRNGASNATSAAGAIPPVSGGPAAGSAGDVPIGEQHPPAGAGHPQYATKHLVPEVWSVGRGQVALTIDDGPSPYTNRILDILERYRVPATFFFVGNRVNTWRSAVLRAARDGNVIGNHSESHPLLTNLDPSAQAEQIESAERELESVLGHPVGLFRPPYGAFNDDTEAVLAKDHLTLALWNRDPRDWEAKTPAQVIDAVVHGNPSGGVFDMHENAVTLAALPGIIEGLKRQGLRFVVLGGVGGDTGGAGSKGSGGQNSTGGAGRGAGTVGNKTGGGTGGAGNQAQEITNQAGR